MKTNCRKTLRHVRRLSVVAGCALGVQAASAQYTPADLLGYWDFDTPGDVGLSTAGIAGDMSLVGATAQTSDAGGRTGAAGDYGIDFIAHNNGASAKTAAGPHFNDLETGGNFTITFWQWNRQQASNSSFWMHSPPAGANQRGIQAHVPWGNGTVFFDQSGCCNGNQRLTVGGQVQLNTWQHWAFVRDVANNQRRIVLNGTTVATAAAGEVPQMFDGILTLGAEGPNNANSLNGILDDFAVFRVALTDADLATVAADGPTAVTYVDNLPDNDPPGVGPEDGNGLDDGVDQAIIDADPGDLIVTHADVLPGDDFDNDGLTNLEEAGNDVTEGTGTDPVDDDSDDDTLIDGDEVNGTQNPFLNGVVRDPYTPGVDPVGDPTDPLSDDSDGDTIKDGEEVVIGADGFVTDPNQSEVTTIVLAGDNPQATERAVAWVDPGVADVLDGVNVSIPGAAATVTVDASALDVNVVGSYPVVYSYVATAPNIDTSITRTVNVVDTTPPIITLTGPASVNVLAGTTYVDQGATAEDANDAAPVPAWNNADAPAASDAIGKYTFDDDSINDSSGNGYDGTPVGVMSYSTDTPFGLGGKSLDLLGGNNAFYVDDGTPNQDVFDIQPFLRQPLPGDPTLVGQWTVDSSGPGGSTGGGSVADFVLSNDEIDAAILADPALGGLLYDNINFGDGGNGKSAGDVWYPGAVNNNPDNIAVRASGMLSIPADGFYVFGFQSDDGSSLLLENTNGNQFETPLLETNSGVSATVGVATSASVAVNSGSEPSADVTLGDAAGPPAPTEPLLEGGGGNFGFEATGALVDDPTNTALSMLVGGVNDTLNVPYNAALNPIDQDIKTATESAPGAGDGLDAMPEMTIELWAKSNIVSAGFRCPISNIHFNSGTERAGWLMYLNGANHWEFRVGDLTSGYLSSGFDSSAIGGFAGVVVGEWYHVVGVVRVDKFLPEDPFYELDLYVNGVLTNSIILTSIPIANGTQPIQAPIRIGATTQAALGTGQNWDGCVDEIALYDTALDAATVLAHYQNGVNSPVRAQSYEDEVQSDAPIAYWRMDDAAPARDLNVTGLFGPNNGGDVRGAGRIFLEAGTYPISFITRERGGGEHAEVFARADASADYDPLTFGGFAGYPADKPLTVSFFAKKSGWANNWSSMVSTLR